MKLSRLLFLVFICIFASCSSKDTKHVSTTHVNNPIGTNQEDTLGSKLKEIENLIKSNDLKIEELEK
jgi:hypothetical protein